MDFSACILAWSKARPRDLPWKETRDPYRIWVSEVILQQTRVQQALGYYRRFLEAFPTVDDLAAAPQDRVLKVWQGLGYYSRARNMRLAAQEVVAQYGGRFPATAAQLQRLKGVGPYTAAAVASFAFGERVPALDGNAHRVLARFFGVFLPMDSARDRKAYADLALELIPEDSSAAFNQAVMDLGALVCSPRPHCGDCPLQEGCWAYAHQAVDRLPVKKAKAAPRLRRFHYLDVVCANGDTWLRKRPAGDIWQGLYDFPLLEEAAAAPLVLESTALYRCLTAGGPCRVQETGLSYTHVLTHQRIEARFSRLTLLSSGPDPGSEEARALDGEGYVRLPRTDLEAYPLPRLAQRYVQDSGGLPPQEGGEA